MKAASVPPAATAWLLWLATLPIAGRAAEPRVELVPVTPQVAFFAGQGVRLAYRLAGSEPVEGTLIWSYGAGARTLAGGQVTVQPTAGPVAVALQLPPLREGVVLETQLTVRLLDSRQHELASHTRPIWLFSREPFAGRQRWLEQLSISLYDPAGQTRAAFDDAEIPYRAVRTTDALETIADGLVVVGEGVSLRARRGLAESMAGVAARGVPVLCLAPADGELPFPAGAAVRSVALRRADVIHDLDKRLDAGYWPPDGRVVQSGFTVAGRRDQPVMIASEAPDAWPWRHVSYESGGQWIVCGFDLIESWDAGPTPRYLLLRVFELLTGQPSDDTFSLQD